MDRIEVSHADLIAALESAQSREGGADGLTSGEVVAATGLSERMAREKIRALIAAGRAEPVRVRRQDMAGRPTLVPGYRLRAA